MTLQSLLESPPVLQLKFYEFGIVMHRQTEQGETAYLVDADQVATTLAARVCFAPGLLSSRTVTVIQEGTRKILVEYRRRQKTALLLAGQDPLVVPLPALLLLRVTVGDERPDYRIYAVKERPTTLDVSLFRAPLPNIYPDGRICWGSVPQVSPASLQGSVLDKDWSLLLGTLFTDHACTGKSQQFPGDIRTMYTALQTRRSRVYPNRDLVAANLTLNDVLERLQQ